MNNYLYHHGVKGMHWGVRKDRASGVSSGRKKKQGLSPNAKKAIKNVALTAGAIAATYVMIKHQDDIANALYKAVINNKNRKKSIDKVIEQMGPEIVKKPSRDDYTKLWPKKESAADYAKTIGRALHDANPETRSMARKLDDKLSENFFKILDDYKNGKISFQEQANRLSNLERAKEIIAGKMAGSFSDYTLDDLKKLDLY